MELVHFIPATQRRWALLAAQADAAPTLISGASGTGKGAIAQWIHGHGPRAGRLYRIADPAEPLSTQMLAASSGTLEIPEISLWSFEDHQILLRYFKTKSIPHPQDARTPTLINVRIIATTSADLEDQVRCGRFGSELLERLNVFRIHMPSLLKRCDEFDDIVMGIVREIARTLHKDYLRTLSSECWKRLRLYSWPGNLRELRNVLHLAIIEAQGDQLEATDLPLMDNHRMDFRATREEFEKLYLLELFKTLEDDARRVAEHLRMDVEGLEQKLKHHGISTLAFRQKRS